MTTNIKRIYSKSGRGTTSRYWDDRLDDVINVKDFGALGDGSHVDTANIQAAVDWNTASATATASSAAGVSTITINAVPSTLGITGGFVAVDVNRPAVIPPGTQVIGIAGNVLTLSQRIVGNGVANGDTINFEFDKRGTIYFPPGNYIIDAPITLNSRGSPTIIFRGDGAASTITGNFQGYIIDRAPVYNPSSGTKVVEKLAITNNHATGGGVRISSAIGVAIRDLQVNAHHAVNLTSDNTVATIVAVANGGSGYAVGDTITLTGGTIVVAPVLTVRGANSTGVINGAPINVTGAVNNGSGLIRLTVDASGLYTGLDVLVASVGGVPNANGVWIVTKIDGTHVDLQGSTFAGAYTSGGTLTPPIGVVLTNPGEYSAYPGATNFPLAVAQGSTSGGGTGATFDLSIGGATQSWIVENVSFTNPGDYVGSRGIISGANGKMTAIDSTGGFEYAVVASGVDVSIDSPRLEVQGTAIALGIDSTGFNRSLQGFNISNVSMESNLTAIDCTGAIGEGVIFGGIIHGFEGAAHGGGNPQYGIRLRNESTDIVISGIAIGGQMAVACFGIADTTNRGMITFVGARASNASGLGGVTWSMPSKAHTAKWINCDNPAPIFTYDNLPTGANVTEGDEFMISDAATGNCDDAACNWGTNVTGGGGLLHRKVRWNGSNWTVVGK